MQVDKDYYAYQQSDYRIADGDVFAQRCNAFIFVIAHKFFLSNNSPPKWRAAYTSHRITAM
jgi:hypothetical protein